MDAAEANRPCTGSGTGYEAWYVTIQQPAQRRGFWIRYTSLRPQPGAGVEPHCALWAAVFDRARPDRNAVLKQILPLDRLSAGGDAIRLGDAELGLTGC